ncbi:hypothetical protein [Streptomyces sp. MNP-20]|uniref:hypothetical protein n=1 Tax=Streptomyces sp. MNP-20 TaxID=2721165 RepID=UPI0015566EC0|nr:hypothetical protein [Streptomyces sp. MNP-20]
MPDLPDAIAHVLAASQQEEDGPLDLALVDHSIWFAYRRPGGQPPFGLALVRGAVTVPTIGQTITLWTKDVRLRVVDIETHYGRHHWPDGHTKPFAAVTVYVDAAE